MFELQSLTLRQGVLKLADFEQVFDEADMLLCGSFENQIIRLIHMLRFDEKLLSRAEDSGKEVPLEGSDEYHEDSGSESAEVSDIDDENEDGHIQDGAVKVENAHVGARKDWRRVRKVYRRSKQYVFVAATLPQSGKKTAGGVLKRMFPSAVWVSGAYLHRHNPRYALCLTVSSEYCSSWRDFSLLPGLFVAFKKKKPIPFLIVNSYSHLQYI